MRVNERGEDDPPMSRNRIEQHPDECRADLNADYRAGNHEPSSTPDAIPASEIMDLFRPSTTCGWTR
jgi:hypothetical protein